MKRWQYPSYPCALYRVLQLLYYLLLKVCHITGNKNCPWKDLLVANDAVNDHLLHGDKVGTCDASCNDCEEFDEATCQCIFVSCPPSDSPSYLPSVSVDPTLFPTRSGSPSIIYQGKATHCKATYWPTSRPSRRPISISIQDHRVELWLLFL